MDPAERARTFDLLKKLTHALAATVGSICEVVLHDFSNPEHSIIAIENGHVTGRKVGDSFGVFGLQVLRDQPKEDLINYRTTTKDGKLLRSSSLFLRDEDGEMIGAMCVNLDLTQVLKTQKLFEDLTSTPKGAIDEGFETSVDEALELLIREAIRTTGKEITAMDREDKIQVISYLEKKGAFLIRYSIDRVAQSLNISKFTVYNYLEASAAGPLKELA
jgi:predicted transcriptional regulator YheO